MARVLFLSGLDRNAATLLERVLGELPGVSPLGEVVRLWHREGGQRCGCGRRLTGCGFWHQVGTAAFGGWDQVDLDRVTALRELVERSRHLPRLATSRLTEDRRRLVEEYASYPARVYEAAAQTGGSPVVVDSSRPGALTYCLHWAAGVDLRVIRLIRAARGVPGSRRSADDFLARCGVPVGYLDYDSFLTDPVTTTRALATFAGITTADADFAFLTGDSVRLRRRHRVGDPASSQAGEVPLPRDGRRACPARHADAAAPHRLPGRYDAGWSWVSAPVRHAAPPAASRRAVPGARVPGRKP